MIQAQDLRIGQAFEYNTSEGWELNIIGVEDIQYGFYHNEYFNEHYRPIQLTEEILLKCGAVDCMIKLSENAELFVCVHKWQPILGAPMINEGKAVLYVHEIPIIDLPCEYLHQLQNIIHSLTNTELEINL